MEYFVTSEGEAQLLRNMVGVEEMSMHLFINDVTPTRGFSRKSFKEPATGGYRSILLSPARWKVEEGDATTAAEARYPKVTYEFQSAVGRVFGYFFMQRGAVLWAVRLPDDAPYFAKWKGDKLHIQPVMRLFPEQE